MIDWRNFIKSLPKYERIKTPPELLDEDSDEDETTDETGEEAANDKTAGEPAKPKSRLILNDDQYEEIRRVCACVAQIVEADNVYHTANELGIVLYKSARDLAGCYIYDDGYLHLEYRERRNKVVADMRGTDYFPATLHISLSDDARTVVLEGAVVAINRYAYDSMNLDFEDLRFTVYRPGYWSQHLEKIPGELKKRYEETRFAPVDDESFFKSHRNKTFARIRAVCQHYDYPKTDPTWAEMIGHAAETSRFALIDKSAEQDFHFYYTDCLFFGFLEVKNTSASVQTAVAVGREEDGEEIPLYHHVVVDCPADPSKNQSCEMLHLAGDWEQTLEKLVSTIKPG